MRNCAYCGNTFQIIQHVDSDDRVITEMLKCKPCGYQINAKHVKGRTTGRKTK